MSSGTITEGDVDPLVPANVAHNDRTIAYVRNMTSPMLGVVAGTLGLRSWHGFLFYLLASGSVSTLLVVLLMQARPGRYVRPSYTPWTEGLLPGVTSYMLAWTLFYGLVHGNVLSIPTPLLSCSSPSREREKNGWDCGGKNCKGKELLISNDSVRLRFDGMI